MLNSEFETYFNENRNLWEKRTDEHLNSEFYAVQDFLNGKSSLNSFELDLAGDVKGKTLLHLQCHFGQDTLSFARLGAKVTGIDFTQSAIDAARVLSKKTGMEAEFHCCNVYDTRNHVSSTFDLVFTSYGTIGWLPDLKPWAKVISDSLCPGGNFVIVDFHPVMWMLDEDYSNIKYSYFNDEVITTESTGTYTGNRNLHSPMKENGWNHPLSDIIGSLTAAGLTLEVFNEYNGSPYNCFPGMKLDKDGLWRFEKWKNKLPLLYGIRFVKHECKPSLLNAITLSL